MVPKSGCDDDDDDAWSSSKWAVAEEREETSSEARTLGSVRIKVLPPLHKKAKAEKTDDKETDRIWLTPLQKQ